MQYLRIQIHLENNNIQEAMWEPEQERVLCVCMYVCVCVCIGELYKSSQVTSYSRALAPGFRSFAPSYSMN